MRTESVLMQRKTEMFPRTIRPKWLVAIPLAWIMATPRAEMAPMSESNLLARATHVVSGRVVDVIERRQAQHQGERIDGQAVIEVDVVQKGNEVKPGERMAVRYWRVIPDPTKPVAPGHYGHWGVPPMAASVQVFVSGSRNAGYDVLSPNGFYRMTKASAPDATRP